MNHEKPTYEELENRLAEAEKTIQAIREGQVDAVVLEKGIYFLRLQEAEQAIQESESHFRNLAEVSDQILRQKDIPGLLELVAVYARRLTGAKLASAGHGYVQGQVLSGAASRAQDLPECPGGQILEIHRGGVYLEIIESAPVIRLTDDEMRAHPRWRGLPRDHIPLKGLMAVRLSNTDGNADGMIMVSHKNQGEFSEKDEAALKQLATLASLNLQQRLAYDTLEYRVQERTAELKARTEELDLLNRGLRKEVDRRKKLEKALKNSASQIARQHEQRKQLAKSLVSLLEKDRAEMSMALHDQAGQLLTAIGLDLELLKGEPLGKSSEEIIRSMEDKITELHAFLRNISRQLRPASLDKTGLIPALRAVINDTAKNSGITARFFTKGLTKRFNPDKELALYRIAQEALTNIQKYARPDEVSVNLLRRDNNLVLTVEDNGVGFDYHKVSRSFYSQNGPLGLTIMQERALQVGGRVWVETRVGKGTLITVEIPLVENRERM